MYFPKYNRGLVVLAATYTFIDLSLFWDDCLLFSIL